MLTAYGAGTELQSSGGQPARYAQKKHVSNYCASRPRACASPLQFTCCKHRRAPPLTCLCTRSLQDDQGAVIAQLMITYEWSDWRAKDIWWIQSVYVAPPHRKQGLFRSLYQHAKAESARAGACGVRLYADNDNEKALKVVRRWTPLEDFLAHRPWHHARTSSHTSVRPPDRRLGPSWRL